MLKIFTQDKLNRSYNKEKPKVYRRRIRNKKKISGPWMTRHAVKIDEQSNNQLYWYDTLYCAKSRLWLKGISLVTSWPYSFASLLVSLSSRSDRIWKVINPPIAAVTSSVTMSATSMLMYCGKTSSDKNIPDPDPTSIMVQAPRRAEAIKVSFHSRWRGCIDFRVARRGNRRSRPWARWSRAREDYKLSD